MTLTSFTIAALAGLGAGRVVDLASPHVGRAFRRVNFAADRLLARWTDHRFCTCRMWDGHVWCSCGEIVDIRGRSYSTSAKFVDETTS